MRLSEAIGHGAFVPDEAPFVVAQAAGVPVLTLASCCGTDGITEDHEVRAHIAREQHTSRAPQQRDVSCAMPRMAVSENQVPELVCRTANPVDRFENGCLLGREPGVDECQFVVALDQKGVCHPHRNDMHPVDHTLRAMAELLASFAV
jgi:hypothetical protein